MKETLNSLINDYMSLTGRPLATLTVEEYIKFSSFAATLPSNSCDTDVIKGYDTNDRNAVKPLTETVKKMSEKKKIKQAIVESAEELGMTIENLDETRSRRDYNRYVIAYDRKDSRLSISFRASFAAAAVGRTWCGLSLIHI